MASKEDDDDYLFNRSYKESARLVVQHWLWLYNLRYVLHPSIPANGENLRIADVGTGNAIWLMELLPHVPASTQLDGFDISTDHYPAKEWLPPNVSLDLLDVFGRIPEPLVGRYDVVHIRTFALAVRNNDPGPLLRNLMKMLKPGGHLQWDEMDFATFRPRVLIAWASKVAAEELMHQWRSKFAKMGILFDWMRNLETLFRQNGLHDITFETFSPLHEQCKAFTDNALMDIEEAYLMFSAREQTSKLGSPLRWRELFEKTVTETKNGASITADMIVVVGRRAG